LPSTFAQERHDASGEGDDGAAAESAALASRSGWRQREKLKTTAVALVLCLNIGVDPPDVVRISPCARLECWVDPLSMQPAKALEAIGKNLQAQYERWQPRAKYKMHLDPTVEDVKKLALSCRRNAKARARARALRGSGCGRARALPVRPPALLARPTLGLHSQRLEGLKACALSLPCLF